MTISTGGFESMRVDLDVPARHGIRQSVGDSVGPGGINRSLRNIPVLVGIARDMEQHCPDAWMLNITNPMTALTRAVRRETSIRAVGLCHEVGNFTFDLAIALRLPHTAVRPTVSGVNHFPVVTALEVDGRDGFEVIAELVESVGGMAALAPDAAPGSARAHVAARLGGAQLPQAVHARTVGGDPGGRRPPSGRVPALDPDRGVRLGHGLGRGADAHVGSRARPGRLHRPGRRSAVGHRAAPRLALGGDDGRRHRLPGHRHPP